MTDRVQIQPTMKTLALPITLLGVYFLAIVAMILIPSEWMLGDSKGKIFLLLQPLLPAVALIIFFSALQHIWYFKHPLFEADENGIRLFYFGGPSESQWKDISHIQIYSSKHANHLHFILRKDRLSKVYGGLWKVGKIVLNLRYVDGTPQQFLSKLSQFQKTDHLFKK